jgi:hypothetical protein
MEWNQTTILLVLGGIGVLALFLAVFAAIGQNQRNGGGDKLVSPHLVEVVHPGRRWDYLSHGPDPVLHFPRRDRYWPPETPFHHRGSRAWIYP